MNTLAKPQKGEYADFYETYISKLGNENYVSLLNEQIEELKALFKSKPEGWENQGYGVGKWSPKEVLGHIIDTERIMTFRALCFARGDQNPLPGFDQNPYVENGKFGQVSLDDLLEDFEFQRKAILSFVKTLSAEVLENRGIASGNPISVRALLWIIPGHFIHHMNLFKERY